VVTSQAVVSGDSRAHRLRHHPLMTSSCVPGPSMIRRTVTWTSYRGAASSDRIVRSRIRGDARKRRSSRCPSATTTAARVQGLSERRVDTVEAGWDYMERRKADVVSRSRAVSDLSSNFRWVMNRRPQRQDRDGLHDCREQYKLHQLADPQRTCFASVVASTAWCGSLATRLAGEGVSAARPVERRMAELALASTRIEG